MRSAIPVALWIILLVTFSVLALVRYQQLRPQPQAGATNSDDPPGRFLIEIPWRHFQDIPPFEMKNQNGEIFDSRHMTGKPYLINFFFAQCPVICREMNAQIANLNEQLRDTELSFISITVDPANDSPEVLKRYAQDFGAQPDRWLFLTDQMYKIVQLGEHVFEVPIGNSPADHTHTEDLLLVDKWGRFRDRFRWNDPYDVRRMMKVLQEVSAETEPPMEKSFRTRNVVAGQPPVDLVRRQWIRDFHLTDANDQRFYSRDLTGEVWIANFFYTRCKSVCTGQAEYLKQLRQRLGNDAPVIVNLSTDSQYDTPAVLREYADAMQADDRWTFCTGDPLLVKRISSEFFDVLASEDHHSSKLYVIDRWHQVRGSFDWQQPDQEQAMLALIEKLKKEDRPVYEPRQVRRPEFMDEEDP